MTIMYKLTTQDLTTHGKMKWAIGVTNRATGVGDKMCTDGVLHCYSDPRLAIIFNPQHADITTPRLFEIKCSTILGTDGLKSCSKEQTPIRELVAPKLTTNQIVAFAIKAALLVYKSSEFSNWAEGWLNGVDRSAHAAAHAAARAADAAYAAKSTRAARAAAYAAAHAADAARAAAYAADAARAARAAARAAAYAADAAARAAAYAAESVMGKRFIEIIDWVVSNIT